MITPDFPETSVKAFQVCFPGLELDVSACFFDVRGPSAIPDDVHGFRLGSVGLGAVWSSLTRFVPPSSSGGGGSWVLSCCFFQNTGVYILLAAEASADAGRDPLASHGLNPVWAPPSAAAITLVIVAAIIAVIVIVIIVIITKTHHTCTCIHIHMCMYTCMCVYICIYIYTYIHTCIHMLAWAPPSAAAEPPNRACVCIEICIYIYI